MKKTHIIAVLTSLLLAVGVFGTSAYFTTGVKTTNVITTGGVSIELIEQQKRGDLFEVFKNDQSGILPGMSVSKIVQVRNIGPNDAYVRISVDKAIELAEGIAGTPDASLVTMDFDEQHWTQRDGYWYYNEVLETGKTTEALFTEVSFSRRMGNEYQGCKMNVDISAQAVQVKNNAESALEAVGWPAAEAAGDVSGADSDSAGNESSENSAAENPEGQDSGSGSEQE